MLEVQYRCVDMETWRSGAVLQACRRGGMEIELWRRAAGAQTWKHRGTELWSSRGQLLACRRRCVEVWSTGGVLQVRGAQTWRPRSLESRGGVATWKHGVLGL